MATIPVAALLDAATLPALVHDAHGFVIECNDRLRRLVGLERPEGRLVEGLFDAVAGVDGLPPVYRRQAEDAVIEARAVITPLMLPDGPGGLMVFTEVRREPERGSTRPEPSPMIDHAVVDASSFAYYQLRAIFDAEGEVIDFCFTDLNPAAERELGLPRAAVIGASLRALHPINDAGGFFGQYREAFLTQRGFEQEYVIPEGQELAGWYAHEIVPLADGVAIFNREIAPLKRAEMALRQILETVPDPIFVMDATGIILATNTAAEGFFGHAREALVGEPVTVLMPADYAARHQEYVDLHLETGRSTVIGRAREVVARLADGREVPVRLSVGSMSILSGQAFVGIIYDLTEVHTLRDDLRTAQKMEALGRLAGGVAHDFNNLLQVIIQNAQLLDLDLEDGEPRELAAEIEQAGVRAAELTRQLLQFSRRDRGQVAVVDVTAAVEQFARMGRRLLTTSHALHIEATCEGCTVVMDPTHFDQVLLNLMVNARDAMPDGGSLSVRTERAVGVEGCPIVRIVVEDEGCGMAPEVVARVFEPFFSTKGAAGTGLGLSTVFGIVSRAGGQTRIESAVGVGTRVIVELPLADGLSTLPPPPRPDVSRAEDLTEVVLVDDDPLVRSSIARWLGRGGFAVHAFASADQAWPTLADGRCACLVTDVAMAGTTGLELAERLARVHPEMPVIFTSGNPDAVPDLRRRSRAPFLVKPFAPDALSALLHEVLQSR